MDFSRYLNPPRYVQTGGFDLQFTVHRLPSGERPFIYEAAIKVPGGIVFLCERWHERPTESMMAERCARFGLFSRRPYYAGQATDDSTIDCVFALYYAYCQSLGVNPTELLARTYPGWETPEKWDGKLWGFILEASRWHGTPIPDAWETDTAIGLVMSLCGQHRAELAETLTQEILLRGTSARRGGVS